MAIAALDIGGTNTGLALLDGDDIKIQESLPTKSFLGTEHVVERLLYATRGLIRQGADQGLTVRAIGVACPGVISNDRKRVIYSPNLNWHDLPLADILAGELGLPVYIENDANLYALGEYVYGAGQNRRDLICFTLGTGVGGGVITQGRIFGGQNGWAAEFGHMIVEPNGRRCGCGSRGCLEAYASATGLEGMLEEHLSNGAKTILKKGDGVKAMDLAARQGDKLAIDIFNRAASCLGIGIINAVLAFGIELVVLGGGVAKGWDIMSHATWQQIENTLTIIDWRQISIETSRLTNSAPLKGAAALARWHLNK